MMNDEQIGYKQFKWTNQNIEEVMKILNILILLICFQKIESKSQACNFHRYEHSNHYQSKKATAAEHIQPGFGRQNKIGGRLLYGAGRTPIRITVNSDDFNSIKSTSNGEAQTQSVNLNFIKRAMLVAKTFYQNRLSVAAEASVLVPITCYDFNPPDGNSSIAGTDMHIYIRYITDKNQGYSATGVSCQWNAISGYPDTTLRAGKPIVGRIIFDTYNIIDNKGALTNRLFAQIASICIHEIMHILGFDKNLYATYMDYNTGNTYSTVIAPVTLHANRSTNYIMKTPAVVAWTKQFFNCSSAPGMPLENQDSTHPIGSHWERLSMYDQLMTGTDLGPQKTITAVTFALFKDMGWYGVDDTFNDTTNYGYNLGCEFFNKACYSTTLNLPKYFCNPANYVNVSECSTTFTGKAYCNSATALMADGCGIFTQYFHCVDPDSVADFYKSYTLQTYGTSSFCVKGTLANAGVTSLYRSRCYPYQCNPASKSIQFTVGVYTVYCLVNEQGATKTVTGMQGYIECPIYDDFCTNSRKICPNWCSQNGVCTRGICNCYSNSTVTYSGADCSVTTCTVANTYYHAATSSCVGSCPPGYYVNVESRACLACSSTCNQCRNEATICTSCQSTPSHPQYFYAAANTCVATCPSNTFLQVDTCIECDNVTAGCATCSGSSTYCSSCVNPSYYLDQFGNCGSSCSGSYLYYDQINMKCRQTCPNTLYLNGSYCMRCTPNYKIIDVMDNNCYASCPPGYYTDSTNYVCGNCDLSCKACSGSYAENCTSCWSNSTLKYLHLSMCLNSCPNGFYADDTAGQCQICPLNLHCATCKLVAGSVQCKTCIYGFYLQSNSSCLPSCDPTFYPNQWNLTCDLCDTACKNCNGAASTSCLNCNSPKYFLKNSTGGYCLDACPTTGYVTYLSTTCLACHQTCATCLNQNAVGCVSCVAGLYLENNQCRYVCSPHKYPNSTSFECLACDSLCTYCYGSTVNNCIQCASGYVLDNTTCTTTCPTGQSPNTYRVCEATAASATLLASLALLALLLLFAL